MFRYVSEGEIYQDFHGLICAGLQYLHDNYVLEAITEIMTDTVPKAYKTIHEKLKQGDSGELLEFWEYSFKRGKGDFEIKKLENEIRLIVRDYPALPHLAKLDQSPDPILCKAKAIFNDALVKDTPFQIDTEPTGTFGGTQRLKFREVKSDF